MTYDGKLVIVNLMKYHARCDSVDDDGEDDAFGDDDVLVVMMARCWVSEIYS